MPSCPPQKPLKLIIPFRFSDTLQCYAWDTGILLVLCRVQKALIILQVLPFIAIQEAEAGALASVTLTHCLWFHSFQDPQSSLPSSPPPFRLVSICPRE